MGGLLAHGALRVTKRLRGNAGSTKQFTQVNTATLEEGLEVLEITNGYAHRWSWPFLS